MNTYKVCYINNQGINNSLYVTANNENDARYKVVREHPDCVRITEVVLVS